MFGSATGSAGNFLELAEFMRERNTPAAARSTPAGSVSPLITLCLLDRRFRQPAFASFHHESLIERIPLALHVGRGRRPVMANIVANQRAGDAELRVGFELGIVRRIDLRNQRLEAFLEDQEMQMRRAEIVPVRDPQQITDGTFDWDRIAGWLYAAETEMTMTIGHELAAQIHVGLLRVLLLVETFRRRMPNIDFGAGNRIAFGVLHPAVHD